MVETEWASALAALESQLDALERQLDADTWDDPVDLRAVELHGEVPPAFVPAARRLAQRLAALEQRMITELAASGEALRELAARRRAARDYHRSERPFPTRSDGSALGSPGADD